MLGQARLKMVVLDGLCFKIPQALSARARMINHIRNYVLFRARRHTGGQKILVALTCWVGPQVRMVNGTKAAK